MKLARLYVARWLIHAGLRVFPDSAARRLLSLYLEAYRAQILAEIRKETPHD